MKFYIAHNYAAKNMLLTDIVPLLEAKGHTITADWLRNPHNDRSQVAQRNYALIDLADIKRADALIYFCDELGWTPGRGKHIEFGAAYQMSKPIYVIGGDCEASVFYFLDDVQRFKTFADFLNSIA